MTVSSEPSSEPVQNAERVVFEQIHAAIIERRLEPGTKLGEEALCDIYGISRAQVRRVLVDLAHSKVVELRRNRGAYVAQPSVREARHVFEARRAVETAIVARAVGRITPSNLALLITNVEKERAALNRADREASIKLSGEFHLYLAEIAGNQVLSEFLRQLVSRTSLIIASYGRGGQSDCSAEDHAGLIEALQRGDSEAAVRSMNDHLEHIESLLQLTADEDGSPADLRSMLMKG